MDQSEFQAGCTYSTSNTYISFVQGLVTKARDGLASDVEQYAREVEESEGCGSLKDGATLLEVVNTAFFIALVLLFQRLLALVGHQVQISTQCRIFVLIVIRMNNAAGHTSTSRQC